MKIKRVCSVLCAAALLVSGCGSAAGIPGEQQSGQDPDLGTGAMGRYMETQYELPGEINRNGGLNWLEDGSMTIISFGSGLYRSVDGGQSWTQEDTIWFPMIQDVYCRDAVMGPDGTVAASCTGEMPNAALEIYGVPVEEGWEGNYCVFGLPDGTVKVTDLGLGQKDGECIGRFHFSQDGRLFAASTGGKVYEVDIERESLRELFMADREVGYMDLSGEMLMAVGHDGLYLYDLESGTLQSQDEVADAFIRQVLSDGTVSYTGGGYPLAVFGDRDGETIYIACEDGLYRHALGGSVMEQIIDGALSTFGDSSSHIYSAKALDDQEFLVLFSPAAGLIRYTFDEDIPSMPDREIKIYSLEENVSVRQAVTSYKKEHTDIYVRYEVGIEGEGGISAEDAVKKLNAQILAGEGPDVLILDGLPVDAYVNKGMLKDLSGILEDLDGEDALLENLSDGFTDENGGIYTMPMCFRVPLLAGDGTVIENMGTLEDFADQMEALRQEYPSGGLLGIYDAETLLELFGMVCSSDWLDGEGQIDEAAVMEYLSQMRRIYQAELRGAVPEEVETLCREDEEAARYGMDVVESKMEISNNIVNIPRGYARLACGYVDSIQMCLDSVTSVLRTEDGLDYALFEGQGRKVFLPKALVGISSRTEQPEVAEEFVRKIFSKETQGNMNEGFPVNRAAFEESFAFLEENTNYGSMLLPLRDGTEEELWLYWPTAEEKRTFMEYVTDLETPVLTDGWLCELVYETGIQALEGDLSVEDGAARIVKQAAIYLAE